MIDFNGTQLTISGDITSDDAELVRDYLQLHGVRDKLVWAQFNSPGGTVHAAMEIHDAIRRHGNVYGCVTGECSSGAVLVYAACSKRIAKPGTRFMVHKSYRVRDGRRDAETRSLDNQMTMRMSRSLGLEFGEVHSWIKSSTDNEFDANEAMRIGLVDLILGQSPTPAAKKRLQQRRTTTRRDGSKRERILAALQSVKGLPPLWNIERDMRTPAMARALSSFTRNGIQSVQGRV